MLHNDEQAALLLGYEAVDGLVRDVVRVAFGKAQQLGAAIPKDRTYPLH